MNFLKLYLGAYILDLILGDPDYSLHPIRVIGKFIGILEKFLYRFSRKKIFGGILAFTVIGITFAVCYFLAKLGSSVQILLLYTTLATRCLGDEGKKVYGILQKGDMEFARKQLSYLVSRDTESMDEREIIRGTFETISENSVDGVIAPMFYAFLGSFFSLGGITLAVPFAMTYKAANTLDSMVGYKNERYLDFGMLSARLDDLLNFIPARLAGGCFIPIAASFLKLDSFSAWRIFRRDRKNHASPNSGNPEAAFAGALGVQLGGVTSYFGKISSKPTIGDKVREFEREDIRRCCHLLYLSSAVALAAFSTLSLLINFWGTCSNSCCYLY